MSGKGSRRRPTQVTHAVLTANWEEIFGVAADVRQAKKDQIIHDAFVAGLAPGQIRAILEERGYD